MVLVTGAAGFVGRALVESLVARGAVVRGMVRRQAGANEREGDLKRPETLAAAMDGVETVFHCAALLGPAGAPMEEFRAVNVEGTRAAARAALERGVRRFVHVSSVAVTGGSESGAALEEDCRTTPRGRYAVTKLESEEVIREELGGRMSWAIVRPAWVFGARSDSTWKLLRLIARRRMVLIGGGRNRVQPVWIDDLVDVLERCGRSGEEGVFHAAGSDVMTTRELVERAAELLDVAGPGLNVPMGLARVAAAVFEGMPGMKRPPLDSTKVDFFRAEHVYTNRRAREVLGWEPRVGWREGIRRAVEAMRSEGRLP